MQSYGKMESQENLSDLCSPGASNYEPNKDAVHSYGRVSIVNLFSYIKIILHYCF